MGRLLALLAAIVVAAALAWATERPPEPQPASAPPAEFSAERAMTDVAEIAREPHPMGSPANLRVRDYLLGRMTALGLQPQVRADDALASREVRGETWAYGGRVENLVGVLPGRDRTLPAVALMAHYDSVPGSPGAADDAAGVAAALEIVRAIKAQGEPVRDVMVVITDGEESGLLGANAFFARDPLARRIGLVLNMESRGMAGRVQMFQTSSENGELIDLLRRTADRPSSSSLSVFVYEIMPNDTDLTESNRAGVPGLNYAFIGRQFDYHAATATPANMDRGTLQDLGDQALSTGRSAAFSPTLPAKAPNAVYSQIFGDVILAYPAWAGWLVLAAAGGLLALGVVRARRMEAFPWLGAARGAGGLLSAVLGAAAVLHFARRATGAEFGFIEQRVLLAQVSRWEAAVFLLGLGFVLWAASDMSRGKRKIALVPVAAGLGSSLFGGFDAVGLGLGLAAGVACFLTFGRPASRAGAWTGVLALTFLAAVGAQIAAPAAAYSFAWPLLLAGLGAAATAMATRRGLAANALLALLAALGLAWIFGLAHLLFLGLDMPELLGLPFWSAAVLLWPLAQPEEGAPPARLVGPIAVAAGLAVLVWVSLDTPWTGRHPQATQVLYHLDQDTGRAARLSLLDRTPWTDRVLAADGGAAAKRVHWLYRQPHDAAQARPIALPAAAVTLVLQADGTLLLTAQPPSGARTVTLRLNPNTRSASSRWGR
ncbi:M20/M25/M40 family metallo-hydrolase [Phenylobacterium sp. J367]|uniref:M20/M25/M40 family metallo-hydrolase n=1 Tax=Phenylobacterium sp. J367 TaxID=2898435 RepID=UPI002151B44C|nr:M20/M25/M40 family metallo-hydrolase [Phenylobacterium sp. J367]MCR5878996.1 M20/M25/M40 family metallo-hydrolase [Phenylobacterium sp. J367]